VGKDELAELGKQDVLAGCSSRLPNGSLGSAWSSVCQDLCTTSCSASAPLPTFCSSTWQFFKSFRTRTQPLAVLVLLLDEQATDSSTSTSTSTSTVALSTRIGFRMWVKMSSASRTYLRAVAPVCRTGAWAARGAPFARIFAPRPARQVHPYPHFVHPHGNSSSLFVLVLSLWRYSYSYSMSRRPIRVRVRVRVRVPLH
jgi:hypothetical protein